METTIKTIKEAQAEREQTKEARSQLQGFMAALTKSGLNREGYIEERLNEVKQHKEREQSRKERRANPEQRAALAEKRIEEERMEAFRCAPLKVGEKVRIKENGMVGEVSRISNKAVSVIVGSISSKLPVDKVERISSNEYKTAVKQTTKPVYERVDSNITARRLNFKPELDIRGERLQEAMETVMHYIDDAIMVGMGSVRIITGKGTGVLREEVQKYLRSVPGIESVSDESIQLGGTGVTIVKFE